MDTDGNKIKLLVVDDHLVVAEGTVSFLSNEPRISVAGTAKNGEECLQSVSSLKPDVVLLDICLPDICGVDLVEKVREIQPQLKVIMFTGQNPQEYINASRAKGIEGFLLKDCSAIEMTEAVISVFEGEVYYSKSIGAIVKSLEIDEEHRRELSPLASKDPSSLLTPRELEVLELVAKGLKNKEIAGKLGIKTKTIEFHVGNILSKLGVNSRLEVVLRTKKLNF